MLALCSLLVGVDHSPHVENTASLLVINDEEEGTINGEPGRKAGKGGDSSISCVAGLVHSHACLMQNLKPWSTWSDKCRLCTSLLAPYNVTSKGQIWYKQLIELQLFLIQSLQKWNMRYICHDITVLSLQNGVDKLKVKYSLPQSQFTGHDKNKCALHFFPGESER